jgi:hypothetical protein
MAHVWLDLAPRRRFVAGIALVVVAGALGILGSFLPWAVPGTAPGMGAAESGWQLFNRFGVYASTHDVAGGYVYYDRGLTGPACVFAGLALIGCGILVARRRDDGMSSVAFWCLVSVWFIACAVLLDAAWAAASSNYDGAVEWDVARTGAKMIGLASLLGGIGGVVALWPRHVARDSW